MNTLEMVCLYACFFSEDKTACYKKLYIQALRYVD